MPHQKHLTLEERILLQAGLSDRLSFKAIARKLQKDPSTLAKEVKLHRFETRLGLRSDRRSDCLNRRTCKLSHVCPHCVHARERRCAICGNCAAICTQYRKEECAQVKAAPYVCNGCSTKSSCFLPKWIYEAVQAHQAYRKQWVEARRGMCFNEAEIAQINQLVSPLLKQRQSIHHIAVHHPDLLTCSERTLYTLVDTHRLDAMNLDLSRKVRMSPRKKSREIKIDRGCRIGRTYPNFLDYLERHDHPPVVQMDTVEGIKGAGNLLTLYFETSGLMLAFKRPVNNSLSVLMILQSLYDKLGHACYQRLLGVILTDNGTEFSNPKAIEFNADGLRRSHVFYCNPSSPFQKGACERNHELIRMVIPKGINLDLFTQDDIDRLMNHINSYSRKKLNDKSPAYTFSQLESLELLELLGVHIIHPNEICLSPELLRNK